MASVSSTATAPGGLPAVRAFDGFLAVSLVAVVAACVRAIWFTPVDAMLGAAQKIFYVHVPAAIAGLYLACGLLAIASIGYLWIKDERLDRLAEASAEVGLLFMGIVLVTGPIWARTSWGTWWVWEARITSTLFLWLLVLGYLVLRGAVETPENRARLSAVMGSLAALLVPFIHLTVKLFRGMHPQPVVIKPEKPSMPGEMLSTFGLATVAFLLLFFALLRLRYRWAGMRDARAAMEAA
ncbi:MAG: cytochrome c biogenesis protein CcsA [Gemmatimonas sp.]|jgi:heme exporter protein C|uniref:cytochrome c biogenesis protein CcsA n=1 Tax=Gemmatimonas sp. TaxID=1962908 RepID=UPI00391F109A|nr:cytochrome c biogenesis protein CcsA [Gemmatimonadota bacterium]